MTDPTNDGIPEQTGDSAPDVPSAPKKTVLEISIFDSPPETGATTAKRVGFPLTADLVGQLASALKRAAAWSPILWRDDVRKAKNFEKAGALTLDWDTPGHEALPDHLRDPERLGSFIRGLAPPGSPLPTFAHATPHGIRLIFILKEPVAEANTYTHAVKRLALELGADLAATDLARAFRSGDILEGRPLVRISPEPLDVGSWLKTSPAFAGSVNSNKVYRVALDKLELHPGSNESRLCPRGEHGESTDRNFAVYENGGYCFSKHGFISRDEIIRAAELEPSFEGTDAAELLRRQSDRFVPSAILRSMLRQELPRCLCSDERKLRVTTEVLIAWATRYRETSEWWSAILDQVFGGWYPRKAREYLTPFGLAHERCTVPSHVDLSSASYRFGGLVPRERPSKGLALKIAPGLCGLADGKVVLPQDAFDRFRNGEMLAVRGSSLVARDILDRPVVGIRLGWTFEPGRLPCEVVPVTINAEAGDPELLEKFFVDLRETVAFVDDDAFAVYVGFLIQPMLAHLLPGQFPVYAFLGPTKSGKDFLATAIPSLLYWNSDGEPVLLTRLPEWDYEMQVLLSGVRGKPFLVFTEAADAKPGQLKILDALATQATFQGRKIHHGYIEFQNRLTIALTAVTREFSDETAGRIAEIRLTESRPERIAAFYRRWRHSGPVLLRTLYDKLSGLDLTRDFPAISGRRPGFGILAQVLYDAFGLDCTYAIRHSCPPILDAICRMHESPANAGVRKGGWTRYSIRSVAAFLRIDTGRTCSHETAAQRVSTALGYGSTRRHPDYCDTGFPAEDGAFFHIELRDEKQGRFAPRRFLYVQKVAGSHDSGPDSTEPNDNDANDGNGDAMPRPPANGPPEAPPRSDEQNTAASDTAFMEPQDAAVDGTVSNATRPGSQASFPHITMSTEEGC